MDSDGHTPLTNAYVRDLYDSLLASLKGSYTDERWHSSPRREFEYRQTARALRRALGKRPYKRMLEIGPGDGVWTPLLCRHAEIAHLVEQSGEMLRRAKDRLSAISGITYEHSDFMDARPPAENNLIIAIRCFEYFESKKMALGRMRELLAPGGRIIIVTKNSELLTRKPVQRTLQSGRVSRSEMELLVRDSGLTIEESYPAVLRLKSEYSLSRFVLDAIQRVALTSRGTIPMPVLARYASESPKATKSW